LGDYTANPSSLTRRRFLSVSAGFGAASLLGLTADAALIEPRRAIVERSEISLARLPREFDGLTIAHLSDFHHDSTSSAELIQDAVRTTNELEPDVVVLTGDYVTVSAFGGQSSAARHAKPCTQLLSELHAPLGVFGVLGNNDHDARLITKLLDLHGIAVLRNYHLSVERAGARLWIAGVDDVLGGGANIEQALRGIPAEGCTVLLAHEPDYADVVSRYRVDLQLSGHSHGGQVNLPIIGAPYLPALARKYPRGLRRVGPLTLYTNRGLGTTLLPIRFDSPPEITFLTLRSAAAAPSGN
jgi:predicted MPP superfamily phosphohydrolase